MAESARSWPRRLIAVLRWCLAFGLIGWLVSSNREQFQRLWREPIHWEFLGTAVFVCTISILLTFCRWYLLVVAQRFPFTLKDALRLGFCGYLFNYVAPGAVGGDVVKAVLMAREQKERRTVAVATVLLDRVLGLLALFMVGAGASLCPAPPIEHQDLILTVLWSATVCGLVGLTATLHTPIVRLIPAKLLMKLPIVGAMIAHVIDAVLLYQTHRRTVWLTVLISIVAHLGMISSFYFCARAVAQPSEVPGYVTHLQLIPLAEIAGVVVPTPGGLGALEGAVQEAYRLSGKLTGVGLLAVVAYRVTTILIAGAGSIFYFASKRQIDQLMRETETDKAVSASH